MIDVSLNILQSLIGGVTAAALLAWLGSNWAKARIDASVKHEYDKLKADYETELKQRERAQLVAELLAEWMNTPGGEAPMAPEQRRKLNKLSFEATLWLPEEIAAELSRVLQHDPRALNMFDLLLRVRTHLSGKHALTVENVTQWGRQVELPNAGIPAGSTNGQVVVQEVGKRTGKHSEPISEGELQAGYAVPIGTNIYFRMRRGELVAEPVIGGITYLRLVRTLPNPDGSRSFVVETIPKAYANDVNRQIEADIASGKASGQKSAE